MSMQVRFGGGQAARQPKPTHPYAGRFFRIADNALSWRQKTENWANRTFPSDVRKNSFFARFWGKSFEWAAENLLNFDYMKMARVPGLGKVVACPPMGALFVILFLCTLPGRLKHAYDRMKENDTREMRDIWSRDIPTFIIILYMFDKIIHKMSTWLQKVAGFQLANGHEVFGFGKMQQSYSVASADDLKLIMRNRMNHKGVFRAVSKQFGHLRAPDVHNQLVMYNIALEKLAKLAPQNATDVASDAFNKAAQEAYQVLQRLERVRNTVVSLSGTSLPKYAELFAISARNSRSAITIASYAIQLLLLGLAPVYFNKWFTEKEYQAKYAQPAANDNKGAAKTVSAASVNQAGLAKMPVAAANDNPFLAQQKKAAAFR